MKAKDYDLDFDAIFEAGDLKQKNAWETEFFNKLFSNWNTYGEGMYLSEKQAQSLCRLVGIAYSTPKQEEQKQYYKPPPFTEPPKSRDSLPPDLLKKLIMLCHPDKHNQSEMSINVTQLLLKMRK